MRARPSRCGSRRSHREPVRKLPERRSTTSDRRGGAVLYRKLEDERPIRLLGVARDVPRRRPTSHSSRMGGAATHEQGKLEDSVHSSQIGGAVATGSRRSSGRVPGRSGHVLEPRSRSSRLHRSPTWPSHRDDPSTTTTHQSPREVPTRSSRHVQALPIGESPHDFLGENRRHRGCRTAPGGVTPMWEAIVTTMTRDRLGASSRHRSARRPENGM